MRKTWIWFVVAAGLLGGAPARAPASPTDVLELLPVLHSATSPGTWHTEPAPAGTAHAHVVDGAITDWTGASTGFAGTSAYSNGEFIYADHLFDSYGADDGADADRVATVGPVMDAVPQTYRVEPLLQADAPGEFGAPNPYPVDEQYGDAGLQSKADFVEVRVAADDDTVYVLARTSAMTAATDTAVLLLADTTAGSVSRSVPFNSGIGTTKGDVAVLMAQGGGRAIDLATTAETPVAVAVNADGYTNIVEAAIPRALVERADGTLSIAVAAGNYDGGTKAFRTLSGLNANIANVAFRFAEPVRTWFDEQQALSLYAKTIDPFFTSVDVAKLITAASDTFVPGPGYFERIFTSAATISAEGGSEGIFQPYGVYLPAGYGANVPAVPLTFWFHWRGGKAHSAATTIPRFMRDMGDGLGGIVVSPRGRGTSTWYLGKGMADFGEVWNDVTSTFNVDVDRVYISGHSMGGWASYLLPILYPDRFAASFPVSPPVTQGAWTGVDFSGCDGYRYDEYSFCYEWANDSNPRVQHTRKLLENLRNVPIAIYAGGADELVPVGGSIMQAERLAELRYRYRLYLFPTYEHYTPPVVDEWMEGTRYFRQFARDPNPARVSYIRDMPFEQSVEKGPSQYLTPTTGLNFDFDHAYWMSGLVPADMANGRASFDGRTLAKADPSALAVPEAGGPAAPGQSGPYAMSGLAWTANPLAAPALSNGFVVTLAGAVSVQLDTGRMGLDTASTMAGTVTFDHAVTLKLAGAWPSVPAVMVNGVAASPALSGGVLSLSLAPGTSSIFIG
ncbi:MAG: prolyl oligopeptidase family serine peptidase [Actinobacteria bacterium]|nr:prolyl oligopeptidase family serine peptidase [Actinomycetota bacterium]